MFMKDWRLNALLNQVMYLLIIAILPGLFVRLTIKWVLKSFYKLILAQLTTYAYNMDR
jgi:fructose-specific phosphotransferase system IIC component